MTRAAAHVSAEPQAPPPPACARETASFNFARASAAIIDPNALSAELINNILRGFGFRASHRCSSLAAGREVARMQPLDLVLIDPFAFGEDAFEFVRWLRHEDRGFNAEAAVLMVTAYTPVRLISRARSCGVDYVVAKPFSVSTLLDRVLWAAGARGEAGAPAPVGAEA